MTTPTPQYTDFSKDVLGRYVGATVDVAPSTTAGAASGTAIRRRRAAL